MIKNKNKKSRTPRYSSLRQLREYGKHDSISKKDLIEVIQVALNNGYDIYQSNLHRGRVIDLETKNQKLFCKLNVARERIEILTKELEKSQNNWFRNIFK